MIGSIFKIPDLRKKIFFTLSVLILQRVGSYLPVPGIDVGIIRSVLTSGSSAGGNTSLTLTDYLDFFAGGAFSRFSVFMLGVMPYITTSIIMQLLLMVFPRVKQVIEEEGGRRKMQVYTRRGTILICLIQSVFAARLGLSVGAVSPEIKPWMFTIIAMITITAGSVFLMWLGEQINNRGIGNGISLLIFTGIVARIPGALTTLFRQVRTGDMSPVLILVAFLLYVVVITFVIYEQQGQRKIPVHYAKRIVGKRMYSGQNTYIPIKINPSGVIPVIFASTVLQAPLLLLGTLSVTSRFWARFARGLNPINGWLYLILYPLLIIFFAYFYTQVSLNPIELGKRIRDEGGAIPGIRSENTEEYLLNVINRIILPGAVFLAVIAMVPSFVANVLNFPLRLAFLLGGTSLLIMVGVILDTMSQIESNMKMHHHEGLVKHGKIRSRNL